MMLLKRICNIFFFFSIFIIVGKINSMHNISISQEKNYNQSIFDLELDQKSPYESVYIHCIKKAKIKYNTILVELLKLIGVDEKRFLTQREILFKKQQEKDVKNFFVNSNIPISKKLSAAIKSIIKNKKLCNTLGIQNLEIIKNTIKIKAQYICPIYILNNSTSKPNKLIAKISSTKILLDYQQINNQPDYYVRTLLRYHLSDILNKTAVNKHIILDFKKRVKLSPTNEKKFNMLFKDLYLARYILNEITSIFDDFDALKEIIKYLCQKKDSFSKKSLKLLQEIKNLMVHEKYYTDPENKEIIREKQKLTLEKNCSKLKEINKKLETLYLNAKEALTLPKKKYHLAKQNFLKMIILCNNIPDKLKLKNYLRAKLGLAKLYIKNKSNKSLPNTAVEYILEVNKQYFHEEEKLKAQYLAFLIDLDNEETNKKKILNKYWELLEKQYIDRKIRAKFLYKIGLKLEELGFFDIALKILSFSSTQTDYIKIKIKSLIALIYQDLNATYKNKAIQESFSYINSIKEGYNKENTEYIIDLIKALLNQETIISSSQNKTVLFLLEILNKTFINNQKEQPEIATKALEFLIVQNINQGYKNKAIRKAHDYLDRLLNEKHFDSCLELIDPLLHHSQSNENKILAYKIKAKIIFCTDKQDLKKSLIREYFSIAFNIKPANPKLSFGLLQIIKNQKIIPEITEKTKLLLKKDLEKKPKTKKRKHKVSKKKKKKKRKLNKQSDEIVFQNGHAFKKNNFTITQPNSTNLFNSINSLNSTSLTNLTNPINSINTTQQLNCPQLQLPTPRNLMHNPQNNFSFLLSQQKPQLYQNQQNSMFFPRVNINQNINFSLHSNNFTKNYINSPNNFIFEPFNPFYTRLNNLGLLNQLLLNQQIHKLANKK